MPPGTSANLTVTMSPSRNLDSIDTTVSLNLLANLVTKDTKCYKSSTSKIGKREFLNPPLITIANLMVVRDATLDYRGEG